MSVEFSEESLRKIAEEKIMYKASVRIHTFIYLTVCGLLCFINFLFTPEFLWFLFPSFAWLIGIAIHYSAYFMYAHGISPSSKKFVLVVLISYVFSMILLWIINLTIAFNIGFYESALLDKSRWNEVLLKESWAIYPTIFAGVGVLILMLVYFIFFQDNINQEGIKSKKQIAIEKEMEKMKQKIRIQ